MSNYDVYSSSQYSGSSQKNNNNRNKKSRKKVSGSSIFTTICVIVAFNLLLGNISDKVETVGMSDDMATIVEQHITPAENCYHYNQLDEYGKHIYREILEQAPSGTASFTISDVSESDFNDHYKSVARDTVFAINFDHPEFFWLGNGYVVDHNSINDTITIDVYQYDFWKNSTKKSKMVNELFSKVDEIVDEANELNSDYEKVKYIHDYVIDTTVYDMEVIKETGLNRDKINPYEQTAYGAIVKGSCVCAGYSRAFQLLTQQLGFECAYISGEVPPDEDETEPGRHAWNIIKLGGQYYYFDTTWDDTDSLTDNDGNVNFPGRTRYNYFALTTDEFSIEHKNNYFHYPECNSDYYNYHSREGYAFDWYSENMLRTALEEQLRNDTYEITFKFSDTETLEKAKKYLSSNFNSIQSSCGYSGEYLRYVDNDLLLIYYRPKQ